MLARGVPDETVLLNLDSEQYYGVGGVGTRFLDLVQQGLTFGEVLGTLIDEYAVERGVLSADLSALVADLRCNGLIEVDAA